MKRILWFAIAATALSGLAVSATAVGGRRTADARAVVKTAYNQTLRTTIVVDGSGRTLYMLGYDTAGKATCAAADPACPTIWPAYATTGKPIAGKGISAALLGTTRGAHGVTQVTYNRHPLYHFHGYGGIPGDHKAGDIHGQDFLQVWWVLSPKGTPIKRLH